MTCKGEDSKDCEYVIYAKYCIDNEDNKSSIWCSKIFIGVNDKAVNVCNNMPTKYTAKDFERTNIAY